MKLSWLAVLSTTLILRVTLVLSQEDSFNPEVNPGTDVDPGVQVDPGTEVDPGTQVDPGSDPGLGTEGDPNVVEGDPNTAVVEGTDPNPESSGGEPVPEEGSEYDIADQEDDGYNLIPHIPDGCSDIRIFSLRGSNEPYPGRGGAMLGIMCSEFEPTGLSCDYEDVAYPANISYSGYYCSSAHVGTIAGVNQMTDYVQKCPNSRLVLMGYSQGASVASDILGGGGGTLFGCEQPDNPPLSRDTKPGSNIAAVVTMGNPRNTANQPYNIGRGSNYTGELGRKGQQLDDLNKYDDIMANWCNHGDPVCAVGSEPVNITAHWSYYDEYSSVASQWVVATALGYTNERLDLDLDGRNESVVLVNSSNNSGNGSGNGSRASGGGGGGGGDEDAAFSFRSNPGGGISVIMLVALVTAGLGSMS